MAETVAVLEPSAMEDSRFLASATAPVTTGLGARDRAVEGAAALDAVPTLLVDVAGFRAAAVADVVPVAGLLSASFEGDETVPLGAMEVRRAAPVAVEVPPTRFLSSSDTDAWDRCVAVEVVDGTGRFVVVEPAAGRVGGLLSPPVVVAAAMRVAGGAVGLAGPVLVAMPGRRTAEVETDEVRFVVAGLVLLAGLAAGALESVVVEVFSVLGDVAASEGGASSWWTTSKPSASDMAAAVASPWTETAKNHGRKVCLLC